MCPRSWIPCIKCCFHPLHAHCLQNSKWTPQHGIPDPPWPRPCLLLHTPTHPTETHTLFNCVLCFIFLHAFGYILPHWLDLVILHTLKVSKLLLKEVFLDPPTLGVCLSQNFSHSIKKSLFACLYPPTVKELSEERKHFVVVLISLVPMYV